MLCFHDFFQKSPARLPLFFAFHLEGRAADRTIGLWLVVYVFFKKMYEMSPQSRIGVQ